jgi:hypothetical protein
MSAKPMLTRETARFFRSRTAPTEKKKDNEKFYKIQSKSSSKTHKVQILYEEKHFSHKYAPLSDSDSEATLTNTHTTSGPTLSEQQTKWAKEQIAKYDIDNLSSSKSKSSTTKSKKMPKFDSLSSSSSIPTSKDSSVKEEKQKKKKKKIGRFFDMSSLATPIAIYNLPADYHGDDPNVYWDEDAQVWRYWYYTWCPIF